MISQRCPRCASYKIRAGHRSTPLFSKFIFRYNLLCNNCNWMFTGFAVPGTVGNVSERRSSSTNRNSATNGNDRDAKEKNVGAKTATHRS